VKLRGSWAGDGGVPPPRCAADAHTVIESRGTIGKALLLTGGR
jgi:hypothetical protein